MGLDPSTSPSVSVAMACQGCDYLALEPGAAVLSRDLPASSEPQCRDKGPGALGTSDNGFFIRTLGHRIPAVMSGGASEASLG